MVTWPPSYVGQSFAAMQSERICKEDIPTSQHAGKGNLFFFLTTTPTHFADDGIAKGQCRKE